VEELWIEVLKHLMLKCLVECLESMDILGLLQKLTHTICLLLGLH
jgi:hypothetical protein